ncbi:MAG: hypothetical protein H7061_13270, partial [Bdellovibrionaceae bacterium]|nr:hypothetical protein [Bdellovibrio sp.]
EITYLTKDNYKPFISENYINDTTIQASMSADILPVGNYDSYLRGQVSFIPGSPMKASPAGSFKVVDNCSQVASSNQSGVITQPGDAIGRTEPPLTASSGNMVFYVYNYAGGQYDSQYTSTVCNQGSVYATVTGTTYGYGFRGCVTPAGTAGCNDIANYHIFNENELPPGYYPNANTKAEASSFPVGKYDAYVAYSAKSITKLASFTVKSCTPERGCEAMEPRCEGKDFVRRNSCKEVERWVNAPDCVARAAAVAAIAPVTTSTCTVKEPTCEGNKDWVRRDSCGKEIGRWENAPAPYCQPAAAASCTVLEPTCENNKDWVRRDSCGKEIERWANAPAPYCTPPPAVDYTGQGQ